MSQIDAAYTAIVTYWRANCPVVTARRCFTDLGGPPFDRPTIGTITNAGRVAECAALVWIRLGIDGIGASTRPLGIDPACKTRSTGVVTQFVYYPLGYGLDFVLPIVDTARAVFHRQSLASGLVQMRDAWAPEHVELPDDRSGGWGRIDCQNPFWITETV